MVGAIILSIIIGIAAFFIHPLLYIGLALMGLIGWQRVRREREHFHTRVLRIRADYVVPFLPGLIAGSLLSLVTIVIGLTVSIDWLWLLLIVYLLTIVTMNIRWISPAYVGAFMIGVVLLAPFVTTGWPWFDERLQSASQIPVLVIMYLTVLLLSAEGMLIAKRGGSFSSPVVVRSKRGKWVGFHRVKRLWLLPVVLFIPEGAIPTFSFWPILTVAGVSLQPLVVPFLIGTDFKIWSSLPKVVSRKVGNQVLGLALTLALIVCITWYVPWLSVLFAIVAIVGREGIHLMAKIKDRSSTSLFTNQGTGCKVLGILPGSPAEKMGIKIGETILRVNGKRVNNEYSFYEALQENSAFCRLEVIDKAGEVRFAQGALYDGEHHQLGVLLVKEDRELQDSVI
ncbi:S1C family serine protease [Halalkalibacterium halodurans]|uniref:S1C family serine protease n=1 Tax=Halalkalibacterium halodurans TaxID=86665 RepID=UPI002E219970|nr:S1C family serine protease [Halalkalibacterium halodurans]MED4164042.1 S1C family serine protease [Halalkalibacterium halodurans]